MSLLVSDPAAPGAHTQAWSTITNTPTTLSGYGITDAQPLDSDLTALAGLSANGLIARTGSGTAATRTITGTADQVVVTNGDGVGGNPTLSLPQSIATGSTPTFAGLGIGTTSPVSTLEVVSSTTYPDVKVSGYGYVPSQTQQFARGTPISPEIVQNGDRLMGMFCRAYRGDTFASDALFAAFVDGVPVANTYVPTRFTWETRNAAGRAERMRLDKDGNLGIGTTSPSEKLHIAANNVRLRLTNGAATPHSRHLTVMDGDNSFRIARPGVADDLTIDSAGNVGIGTTTPKERLDVAGAIVTRGTQLGYATEANAGLIDFNGGNARFLSFGSSGSRGGFSFYAAKQNNVDGLIPFIISSAGSIKFGAYGAGTLQTDSSGNVTASSDASLKTVTGSFTRGLADVLKLTPRTYHWNEKSGMDTEDENVGFIAQEVLESIPEAVGQYRTSEVEVDGEKTKKREKAELLTLSDRPLIAALVNAVKELSEQNAALVKRIAALEMAKK